MHNQKSWPELMDYCNGEIRIKPNRYGGGFICVILLLERMGDEDEWWGRWDDMTGCDPEWDRARGYFEDPKNQTGDLFGYGWGETPLEAFTAAERVASAVAAANE